MFLAALFEFLLFSFVFSILNLDPSLCSFSPSSPNVCLVNTPIYSKSNITISTDLEIIIFYTSITCQPPCTIKISSNIKISLLGSILYASSISLYSLDQIGLYDSVVSTNGTISMGKGYTNILLQGFGFAGMGSVCIWWEDISDNSYGSNCAEYSNLQYLNSDETQGSGGIRNFEKGGGRIIVKAEKTLVLSNSNITASGFPSTENTSLCEAIANQPYLKGGTGGFILLEAEKINYNSIKKTRVEAKGGNYCGRITLYYLFYLLYYLDFGWGGSGGRINLISNNADDLVHNGLIISLKGGRNLTAYEEFCSNGATGTLCLTKEYSKNLYIDGEFSKTQSATILSPSDLNLIDNIYILNNALSSFHMYSLKGENLIIYDGNNLHIYKSDFQDFVHPLERIFLNVTFKIIEIVQSYKFFKLF